jgi:neutral trehalase
MVDTSMVPSDGEYPAQDGFGWTNGVYLDLVKSKN